MSGNYDFPPATRQSIARSGVSRHLLHHAMLSPPETQPRSSNDPDGSEDYNPYTGTPPRRHFTTRPRRRGVAFHSQADQPISALMEHLENATSAADSLVHEPIPAFPQRTASPGSSRRDPPAEGDSSRRRKRRKIAHQERSDGLGMKGFRYGHRGSVVSGPLKMEIEACDGGVISAQSMHGQYYVPENVLRNDQSVYCTDQSLCNLVLKHKNDTTFSLTKLVIKSPDSGFTAPLQEGLVFISMTPDNLIGKTSQYKLVHCALPARAQDLTGTSENRPQSRRRDSTVRHVPPPVSDAQARAANQSSRSQVMNMAGERPALLPGHFDHIALTDSPPPFGRSNPEITGDCDTLSSDEEEPSSPGTLEDRRRRDIEPPSYDHDTSDENDVDTPQRNNPDAFTFESRFTHENRGPRGRRLAEPSWIEAPVSHFVRNEDDDRIGSANDEDANADKGLRSMIPLARFFIAKDKSVVSIKFDPPAAGKYLLLKLWSPVRGCNIDIQSIIAHGFAGPRYFPAEQLL